MATSWNSNIFFTAKTFYFQCATQFRPFRPLIFFSDFPTDFSIFVSTFLFFFLLRIYLIFLFWPCLFTETSRAFEKDKVQYIWFIVILDQISGPALRWCYKRLITKHLYIYTGSFKTLFRGFRERSLESGPALRWSYNRFITKHLYIHIGSFKTLFGSFHEKSDF